MVKKLQVDYKCDINKKDLTQRRYTLTHSDITGQRFLFIGNEFAENRCNKLRDEVVGLWIKLEKEFELHIMCNLYSEHSSLTIEERYEKFKTHMPRAISAIVNGDKEYLVVNNLLAYSVYVHFLNDYEDYKESYGQVSNFIEY